jgi:hypothetical protein
MSGFSARLAPVYDPERHEKWTPEAVASLVDQETVIVTESSRVQGVVTAAWIEDGWVHATIEEAFPDDGAVALRFATCPECGHAVATRLLDDPPASCAQHSG